MTHLKSFSVALFLLVSAMVFAQPPAGGQRGPQGPPPIPNKKEIKQMVSDLAEEVSLTKKQETKILKLYNNHFEAVKEKTSNGQRPERKEMEALKTSFEKDVKAALLKEQVAGYEAFIKKQHKKRGQRPERKERQ